MLQDKYSLSKNLKRFLNYLWLDKLEMIIEIFVLGPWIFYRKRLSCFQIMITA